MGETCPAWVVRQDDGANAPSLEPPDEGVLGDADTAVQLLEGRGTGCIVVEVAS